MRVCIDVDGTICITKAEHESYADVVPIPGAIETIKKLKEAGHYIIIATARGMKTYESNLGKIVANQSTILVNWLDKHDIPYDEIWFGKPLADYYIDDKGFKFTDWKNVSDEIL